MDLDRPKLHSIISTEFFGKKGFSPENEAFLVDMCVVRPELLSMVSGENRKRLDDTFAKFTESLETLSAKGPVRSPTALLVAIADHLTDPCIDTGYPKTVDVVLRRFWAHPDLPALFNTSLKNRMFEHLLEEVKRTDEEGGTDLASYLEREDSTLAIALTRGQTETQFQASMASGCRKELLELRESGLDRIPCLREVISLPKPPSTRPVPSSYLILKGNNLVREFRQRA